MFLFITEISFDLLIDTGIGRTLKYFLDYCKLYENDFIELKPLISMIEQILRKWKNFVNNMIFDEQKDNSEDFLKFKYTKKIDTA